MASVIDTATAEPASRLAHRLGRRTPGWRQSKGTRWPISPLTRRILAVNVLALALLAGGFLLRFFSPRSFEIGIVRSGGALALAGLLVGFGTRLGNGCTSGHGICGISRGSKRSLIATATFMATGAAAVYLVNHLLGGAL